MLNGTADSNYWYVSTVWRRCSQRQPSIESKLCGSAFQKAFRKSNRYSMPQLKPAKACVINESSVVFRLDSICYVALELVQRLDLICSKVLSRIKCRGRGRGRSSFGCSGGGLRSHGGVGWRCWTSLTSN